MKRTLLWLLAALVMVVGLAYAADPVKPKAPKGMGKPPMTVAKGAEIAIKLSGPGAVNDSTIKVGQKVSVDLYFSNDKERKAFTAGFKISSPDIKTVVHPADSGKGVNETGDIKGYNGWQDNSVWDLKGILVNKGDWDGNLPDYVGLGGVAVKQRFNAQPSTKQIGLDLIVPEPGTLIVDSVFFPPGGYWKFADGEMPIWKGPYKFMVVK
jgi:hypothetical protein